MIEANGGGVVVDVLGRVGVQGAVVAIGAVGEFFGEGVEEVLEELADGGVSGARCSFVSFWDYDVAVNIAAEFALAGVGSHGGILPGAESKAGTVLVIVGGAERADGKKAAGV